MDRNGSASCPLPGADWLRTESGGSTDIDHGQEQRLGARQLSTDSAGNPRTADAALQRRLATGRESQRRFRERQKVMNSGTTESFGWRREPVSAFVA